MLSGCVTYTGPERRLFLVAGQLAGDWHEIAEREGFMGAVPTPKMTSMEIAFTRKPDPDLAYKLASFYGPLDVEGSHPSPVNRMTRAYELLVFAAVNGHRPAIEALASIHRDGPMDHPVDRGLGWCLEAAAKATDRNAAAAATADCGVAFDGFSPARLPARLRPPPLMPAAP